MMNALMQMIPPISYDTRLSNFILTTLLMISAHMLEFGIAHYAMRRYKTLSGQDLASHGIVHANAEKGLTQLAKIEFMVVKHIHLRFEMVMRFLSPVVYAIAAGVILH
eukprot:CAMPEP_0172753534 /NCGR_PEP_ID=MMETSP1074-20121228/156160_1 /TAXON_ID=2916 /ORGANISM="Ceratium fusus, Strain PA161109" /LENGTH=107 /DNA_ID=CAMNT_0013586237 /DNA_START=17 /DNA_END=340 /DNA_ORIENTATION=-